MSERKGPFHNNPFLSSSFGGLSEQNKGKN